MQRLTFCIWYLSSANLGELSNEQVDTISVSHIWFVDLEPFLQSRHWKIWCVESSYLVSVFIVVVYREKRMNKLCGASLLGHQSL